MSSSSTAISGERIPAKSPISITARRRSEYPKHVLTDLYRFRAHIFADTLRWDISVTDGLEIDQFDVDELDPIYVIAHRGGELVGTWRLLPTTGPYLMGDVPIFSVLAENGIPRQCGVWEISRFAVTDRYGRAGMAETTLAVLQCTLRLSRAAGIHRYVFVTTLAVERLMRKLGLNIARLGPPQQIGVERTVACAIEVDAHTEQVLTNHPPQYKEFVCAPHTARSSN